MGQLMSLDSAATRAARTGNSIQQGLRRVSCLRRRCGRRDAAGRLRKGDSRYTNGQSESDDGLTYKTAVAADHGVCPLRLVVDVFPCAINVTRRVLQKRRCFAY